MAAPTALTAYLNSSNEVVSLAREVPGRTTPDLAKAQAKNPAVDSRIGGAPLGLVYKGKNGSTFFHKKTSGDGTAMAHYTQVEDLTYPKLVRRAEIDRRTAALIAEGFVHDSRVFSLSAPAQLNWINRRNPGPGFGFPFETPTLDGTETYSFANAAAINAASDEASDVREGHCSTGTALKKLVNAATDQGELDAVVDSR